MKEIKVVLIIILSSLSLTLIVWRLFDIPIERNDTLSYVRIAVNVSNHRSYSLSPDAQSPTSFRLPGYPLFLLPFVKEWPNHALDVSFIQAIMLSLMSVMTYYFAGSFSMTFGPRIFAVILFITNLFLIVYSKAILTDLPAAFYFYVCCFIILHFERKSAFMLIMAGCFFTLGVMNRAGNLLLIFLVIYLIYLTTQKARNASRKQYLKSVSQFLIPLLLFLGIWIPRNYSALGYWNLSTYEGHTGLWFTYFSKVQDGEFKPTYKEYRNSVIHTFSQEHPVMSITQDALTDDFDMVESEAWNTFVRRIHIEQVMHSKRTIISAIAHCANCFFPVARNLLPEHSAVCYVWTFVHSVIVSLGLVAFLLARNRVLLRVSMMGYIYILVTVCLMAPYFHARFLFPISCFISIVSVWGFVEFFKKIGFVKYEEMVVS